MASLGQALREEREARNISIEEIASATKIVSRYLEALEADRLDQMPGGFFIRGIIRTYAKSVGLDPEEVVNRYKAAGLLEAAAPERKIFPKLAPMAAARPEPAEPVTPVTPVTPVVPAEPAPAIEPAPAAEPEAPPDIEKASPTVHFEEAPKPRLSEAARKRILAWTWRGLAAVLLVAVIIVVWPSRRHKADEPQPGRTAAEAVVPPTATNTPGTTPSSAARPETVTAPAAQAEPAPPGPSATTGLAPAAEKAWKGLTVEITFQAETWIQVRTDGELKIDGLFPPAPQPGPRPTNVSSSTPATPEALRSG